MKPNVYSGGSLDRAGDRRDDAAWLTDLLSRPTTRLVPVWRGQFLVNRAQSAVRAIFPSAAAAAWLGALPPDSPPLFLGIEQGAAHFAVDLAHLETPCEVPELAALGEFAELREVVPWLSQSEGAVLAYARGLVHWHRTHGFCPRCGAATAIRHGGHIRQCTACRTEHYPRTDPAIIVLVSFGAHCLLGRQARWRPGMFSTLAGFVEPGESLEEAVAREVKEESGVTVSKVRYHSSQPWPFPSSLMVGFRAEAEALSPVRVDEKELEAAAWFTREDIARFADQGKSLPNPDSIARRLIEGWLAEG